MNTINSHEGEPQVEGKIIRQGDIVVYVGTELTGGYFENIFYYVDNPEEYGGNRQKATLLIISNWASHCLGFKREELTVVGHVEPFETNTGRKIYQEGNFLPANKKETLMPWLGRRNNSPKNP